VKLVVKTDFVVMNNKQIWHATFDTIMNMWILYFFLLIGFQHDNTDIDRDRSRSRDFHRDRQQNDEHEHEQEHEHSEPSNEYSRY
jgi:hypothetical protein